MDELLKFLASNEQIKHNCIEKFIQYIRTEEYDTDSLKMDVVTNDGNIAQTIFGAELVKETARFAKIDTRMHQICFCYVVHEQMSLYVYLVQSTSFAIGYTFYYWGHYQGMTTFEHNEINNLHDHSGYTPKDLVIERKYSTFKEEIYNYKHISIDDYMKIIVPKIESYIKTNAVKETVAEEAFPTNHKYHASYVKLNYDINTGDPI